MRPTPVCSAGRSGRALLLGLGLWALAACHDARRDNPLDPALTPPVWLAVAVDEGAGTAALTWSAYAGDMPLREYLVLRQTQGLTRVDTLAVIADPAVTGFTDTTMAPNTPYAYQVAVVNPAGLESASQQVVTPGYGAGPVRLLWARPEPRAGAVAVGWSRFRQGAFEAYEVRRRTGDSATDTLVAVLSAVGDTSFADLTARADPAIYYLYRVVVRAAGETFASNELEARLQLPPVTGLRVRFDSRTATATISWQPYDGPRFAQYRVWRRTPILAAERIAAIGSAIGTAVTDSGLAGGLVYSYRVEVATVAGETATSAEVAGQIHALLSQWSTDLQPGQVVRLYGEAEGITALVAGPARAESRRYDPQGRLLGQALLLFDWDETILPRSVALARRLDGTQLLAYAFAQRSPAVYLARFDADGAPLFGPAVEVALAGDEAFDPSGEVTVVGRGTALDRVVVLSDGREVFADGFDGGAQGWDRISKLRAEDGIAVQDTRSSSFELWRTEASWGRMGIVAESYVAASGLLSLHLGRPGALASIRVELRSGSLNVGTRGRTVATARLPQPIGLRTRLGVDSSTGPLQVALWHPLLSSLPLAQRPSAAALALVEGRPGIQVAVVSADDRAFVVSDTSLDLGAQPRVIDEVRAWRTTDGRQWIGVCQAEGNQVLLARASVTVTGRVALPGVFGTSGLNQAVGQGEGEMIFPMSLAGGADGRVYVLDAGNGRIQVFDLDGVYVTQWGRSGLGDGEFAFGRGLATQDFWGSVAADGQGSIYVADSSGRIQRFAP